MAAVDALSSSASQPTSTSSAFSALDSEQFVKIIFTELSNQDPLAPSDSKALLQELSTLRSIQSDMDLSTRLKSLVGQNEWTSAAGLIGKNISGISDQYERVQGVVKSVSRTDSGAVLNLANGDRARIRTAGNIREDLERAG